MTSATDKTNLIQFTICYGFLEGTALGKELRTLLESEGYVYTDILSSAQIIIAHSAAYLQLSNAMQSKYIFLVGAPLPQAQILRTFFHTTNAIRKSFMAHRSFRKTFTVTGLSAYYALRQPHRNRRIIRLIKQSPLPFTDLPIIFISNKDDPWHHTPLLAEYITKTNWIFLSLTGSHDNIWEHPTIYRDIVNQYARLLATTSPR